MINYKELIATQIAGITSLSKDELINYIEVPANTELGDYAFPCFKLAKELKNYVSNVFINHNPGIKKYSL